MYDVRVRALAGHAIETWYESSQSTIHNGSEKGMYENENCVYRGLLLFLRLVGK